MSSAESRKRRGGQIFMDSTPNKAAAVVSDAQHRKLITSEKQASSKLKLILKVGKLHETPIITKHYVSKMVSVINKREKGLEHLKHKLPVKKKHEFSNIPQVSKTAIQLTKHEKLEKENGENTRRTIILSSDLMIKIRANDIFQSDQFLKADFLKKGNKAGECSFAQLLEPAEEWPVFTYTVRNMAPICEQYLEYIQHYSVGRRDNPSVKLFQSLARTGKFSDLYDKNTFQLVSTKLAQKIVSLDKITKKSRIVNDNEMDFSDLFSPVIILASQTEAKKLFSLLEPINKSLYPVVVAFLTNNDERKSSERMSSKSILWITVKVSEIFEKLDATIMEKAVFQLASSMAEVLKKVLQRFNEPENEFWQSNRELRAKQLLSQIQAMYRRSDIPEVERPWFPRTANPELTKTVVSIILTVPNVVGCGKVFNVIEVAINEKIRYDSRMEETFQMIEKVMKDFAWTDYIYRVGSGKIEHLYSSGDQVRVGERKGTLGAFANAYYNTEQSEFRPNFEVKNIYSRLPTFLIALISRHIVNQNLKLYCDNQHIGDVMRPFFLEGADIAAARVFDKFRESCTQVFKKQNGIEAPCRLLRVVEDLDKYVGHIVHIWGAVSKPGLGIISSCEYGLYSGEGRVIIIRDKPSKCFASKGDSGSVVCMASKTGKELYAIGMLMGEYKGTGDHSQENQYAAMDIQFAKKELEKRHQITIDWIDTE